VLQHLVHTVKSIAGLVGADTFVDVCQELETALGEGRKEDAADLPGTFERERAFVVDELTQILQEQIEKTEVVKNSVSEACELSMGEIVEKLESFVHFLEEDFDESRKIFAELTVFFQDQRYQEPFEIIKKAIDEYDTDTAKEESLKVMADFSN